MGGCATKPRVLESEEAPAPVETLAPAADAAPATTTKNADTVLQEHENGGETEKEPLVDVTEVAVAEAPKEEATTNAEEVKPAAEAEAEEKKEVAETVATPEAPKATETVVAPVAPEAAETVISPEAPKA